MKHDLAHEEKQNEALKLLAQAIEGVADQCGWLGAKALALKVEAILAKDEADGQDTPTDPPVDVPAPPADTTSSDTSIVVAPPSGPVAPVVDATWEPAAPVTE